MSSYLNRHFINLYVMDDDSNNLHNLLYFLPFYTICKVIVKERDIRQGVLFVEKGVLYIT